MKTQTTVSATRMLPGYVAAVLTLGAGLLIGGWARADVSPAEFGLVPLAFWLVLSLAAECFWLETPTGRGMISMSLAVNMAILFVLPFHLALSIGALSVGLSDLLLHRRGPLRASFNAAQTAVSLAASLGVVHLLGGAGAMPAGRLFLHAPLAVLAAPITFFAVNTLIVAGVIALHTGMPFWSTWRENYGFGYQALSCATLATMGIVLLIAIGAIGYIAAFGCLLPLFFVRDAFNRYVRERRERLSGSC